MKTTIAIGADHGGFELKQALLAALRAQGHELVDCGTHDTQPVDYPDIAADVARRTASGASRFGIVIDGAGIGSAMAANKIPGARAAACYSEDHARNAREHNDANILSLGARFLDTDRALKIAEVFLSSACTEERHQRRVAKITAMEQIEPWAGLAPEDLARIAQRVQTLGGATPAPSRTPPVTARQLASMIDHTVLKPEATRADIETLCREAREHRFFSVCVNPANVAQAAALLKGSPVKVCSVVGFPLGAQAPEIKALEARRAIREGAKEIDMVINVGALKSGDDKLALKDIRAVVEACRDGRALCKVILETALLTNEEKERACALCVKAGADFVKTSTGFSKGGATQEDIALMSRVVADRKLGVKASGGVRTYADAVKMIQAGATRIGSSNSVKMIREAGLAPLPDA